jgi:BASS family bile acid:Na+ symporter
LEAFTRSFALWIVLGAAVAFAYPPAFTWFATEGLVAPGLGVIMLGMGLTLEAEDFLRVARAPRPALTGILLQYTVMPLAGWAAASALALPAPLAAGLILVCCCPGGTASNVIAFLARADVALSVSMTALSTLGAALLTPTLSALLIGDRVEVDAVALFLGTAKVVLLPVLAGVGLRRFLPALSARLLPFAPPLAVVVIVLIVGAILGLRREAILDAGPRLLLAIVSAHGVGFVLGYLLGGLASGEWPLGQRARTVSIEVGMQNSGLGATLAGAFADPLVAVPSAISAVVHCLYGSALAAWWVRRPPPEEAPSPGP